MCKKIEYGYNGNMLTVEEVVSQLVPRGWESLVTSLLHDLFKLSWDGRLVQIKEKYGGLRFYTNAEGPVYRRIEEAERKSYTICIHCGREGSMRTDTYWIHPACDKCYDVLNIYEGER